jgi:uncharacterized membrane protein
LLVRLSAPKALRDKVDAISCMTPPSKSSSVRCGDCGRRGTGCGGCGGRGGRRGLPGLGERAR